MDIFLLNGPLTHPEDAGLFEFVDKEKQSDELLLIPVTYGGDPDAAYKIGRHLQGQYTNIKVLVSGCCKSAGTLLAIAGHELIFGPYGELGPLDVQVPSRKNPDEIDSGLDIDEGLRSLESRSRRALHNVMDYLRDKLGEDIPPETVASIANGLIGSTHGNIFKNFDPVEVGARARAMKIGDFYGRRLSFASMNLKGNNAKEMHEKLQHLLRIYPSHTFVIDIQEASLLFERVRHATEAELTLIREQGAGCLIPRESLCLQNLTGKYQELQESQNLGQ